jgi:LPS-assembly lipoprotein
MKTSSRLNIAMRSMLIAVSMLMLAACGFHLRGMADFSFKSLYVHNAAPSIMPELKRQLKLNGIVIVQDAEEADMQLDLMGEAPGKRILSLSGGGKVSEYALTYRVAFRTRFSSQEPWGAPQTIEQSRDYTYDNTIVLAKTGEEDALNKEMRVEAAQSIIRRLSALKRPIPAQE